MTNTFRHRIQEALDRAAKDIRENGPTDGRFTAIRDCKRPPNRDDPEEMRVAREAGLVIDPIHHRSSS